MATIDDKNRRLPKFVDLVAANYPELVNANKGLGQGFARTPVTAPVVPEVQGSAYDYPKALNWYDPDKSFGQTVAEAGLHAGPEGSTRNAGARLRSRVGQVFGRPVEYGVNSAVEAYRDVTTPTFDFLGGLFTGEPASVGAPTSAGGAAPNYPNLLSVLRTKQEATAPALARTPSRGQPAPVVPPAVTPEPEPDLRRDQQRAQQADQNFDINNVPQGGGFISFDQPLSADRLARMSPELRAQAQTGAIRITPDRARELAGQGTTVPAGTIAQLGGGLPQQVFGVQGGVPSGQPNAPRRSTLIGDRSQDYDTLLNNLVAQATREPDSYGALFQRKGVLNALNNIAGVAQSAGTNAAQDIANTRNAVEQRYSTELTDRSREADRGVTAQGQNLNFQSGLLQSAVSAGNAALQAETTRDVNTSRNDVLREGYTARARDAELDRKARAQELADAPAYRLAGDPEARNAEFILKGINPRTGAQMTPEETNAEIARHNAVFGGSGGLADILAQMNQR